MSKRYTRRSRKFLPLVSAFIFVIAILATLAISNAVGKYNAPSGDTPQVPTPSETPAPATNLLVTAEATVAPTIEPEPMWLIHKTAYAVPEDVATRVYFESMEIAKMLNGESYDYEQVPERWKAVVEADCIAATQVVYYRVISADPYYPDDVQGVVAQSGAFYAYSPNCTPTDFNRRIAAETLLTLYGYGDYVNLTVPEGTLFFSSGASGDYTNSYRMEYRGASFLPQVGGWNNGG
jgi:hypothetical protein